ncbi:MAG: NADP-dependent malic enzyme [Gemmatimonadetes bacterium]|nr:MAG: NADP-dependent malic enzyme [Gemmatimonadota bacterium]
MKIPRQNALEYHEQGRPGKIEVVPTKPVATQADLSLAYSPGVAEPCLAIADNPDDAFRYTARGNLVAVVSNGTAVLGLGNLGALASKPVMEGKGVLFKKFAGIDVFDIEVDSEDPEEIIRFCELLEPTVGGINLEDISAPACFEIESRLRESLEIPVFHDDQHGTAIIAGAALLNALDVVGKKIEDVRVVFSGAGASAMATARHFQNLGVDPEKIVMCDSHGVIYRGREEAMDRYKEDFARDTDMRTLTDALEGADVFVGLSVGGVVKGDMVARMAERPLIFALANPDPEITPEEVKAVRDDAIMATGRSDYPNQVNNVLGFPFIFRGALDVRARGINEEMKLAATRALADLARADVPETVAEAYGGTAFAFGPEYLIPKPFDPRVLYHVAPAVARAAMETGLARVELDLDEYVDRLRASLGPGRQLMRTLVQRARREPKRVVLADGYNLRIIRAAAQILEEGIARPILLGRPDKVYQRAEELGVSLEGATVFHQSSDEPTRYRYADALFERRARKGLTLAEAKAKMYEPTWFGSMMVLMGDADAMVAGTDSHYPEIVRPALQVVGTADGVRRVAGVHLVALPNRDMLFFADTTMNIDPDEETLAEVALLTAGFAEGLGLTPRIAMLSFSNFGSAPHDSSRRVAKAVERVRELRPDLEVDGEMQADTAVNDLLREETYPFARLSDSANVLVFPSLGAANIAYKLLGELGGAEIIGPVLLGMARPIHVSQRGATVQDLIHLITIACVDAQARSSQV